jgi:carbamate kinase
MRIVVAVGGNSLIRAGQRGTMAEQWKNVLSTTVAIADLVRAGHQVLVTHGNGPQVGNLLLMAENTKGVLPKLTLDYWGANTQGGIGYLLQSSVTNELRRCGVVGRVITLATMVVVGLDDPAFENPTKPVGPFFTRKEAQRYAEERNWCVAEDSGRGWRRRVPSPRPVDIVEIEAVRDLLERGYVVIGVGGGGIPVIRRADGTYHGVEAVIDKDLASALAARLLGAEVMLLSTDVSHVVLHHGRPEQRDIGQASAAEMARYAREGHFPPGSMGPKVEAALEFLKNGGRRVVITDPAHLASAIADPAVGTSITP